MLQSNSGFADVHGTQLYFEVAGTGQALVLLHEGIADHRMWDAQFAEFARQYRVVRYDARGFGRSPMPPEPFFRHEDLRGLLEALGIDHAILLGASMGGATALDAALTYPQMVDALVLAASGLGGYDFSDETKQKWAEIDAAYERDGVAQAVEFELQMWVDGPFRTPDQVDPAVGGVQSRRAQLPAHVSESERLMISSRPPKSLTARDRLDTTVDKVYVYAQLGVPEYIVFDPIGTLLHGPIRAWRLDATAAPAYTLWLPDEHGRLYSTALRITLLARQPFLGVRDQDAREIESARVMARRIEELEQRLRDLEQRVSDED